MKQIQVIFLLVACCAVVVSGQLAAPTLTSPVNGQTEVGTSPVLTWNAPTDGTPDTYLVQVSTVSTFVTKIVDDSTTSLNYPISTVLANSTTYYWKVAAKNANDIGSYAFGNFTTIVAMPGSVTLTSPVSGATDMGTMPTLTWNAPVIGGMPAIYLVKVSTASTFTSTVVSDSTVSLNYTISTALANNTTYYWEVAAKNVNATGSSTSAAFTTIVAAPGAVTLISPLSGATGVSQSPVLTWSAAATGGAPAMYVVYIGHSYYNSFLDHGTITDVYDSTTNLSYAVSAALPGSTSFTWQIYAKNKNSTNYGSSSGFTTIIAPPGAVTLTSPINGATGVSKTPTLSWNSATTGGTPDKYLVQVSTSSAFISMVINDSTTSLNYVISSSLLDSVTYYWKVAGKNANCTGTWASAVFTTVSPLSLVPGPVMLTAPVNGATNQSTTPTLSWSSPTTGGTPEKYMVKVSTESTFASMVINDSTAASTYAIGTALPNNTTLYWEVAGKNGAGSGSYASAAFTTIIAPPGAVTLTSPTSGATGVSLTPTLTWTAPSIGGAPAIYVVYIGHSYYNSMFDHGTRTDVYDSTTNLNYTVSTPLPGSTSFSWQIYAKNRNSTNYGSSSGFTSIIAPPGAVTLTSPINGATGVSKTPTLSWNAATTGGTPDKYLVQVSSSSAFTNMVINDSTTSLNYVISSVLLDSVTYYWKVAGKNANCTGTWASAVFTTVSPTSIVPGPVTLTAPVNGATNQSITPTLSWSSPATGGTPEKYLVKVSMESTFASMVINDSTAASTYVIGTALPNSTTIYWKVAGKNGAGSGSYSSAAFTTIIAAPGAVTLTSPSNGATEVSLTPTLTWNAPSTGGAPAIYVVYIGHSYYNSMFDHGTRTDVYDSTTNLNYTVSTPLPGSTTFSWQIYAKNKNSTNYGSSSGFTTNIAPPGAVTLTSPVTSSTGVNITPTLTWNAPSTGGTPAKYMVKVSTSSDFASTVINDSTTSLSYTVTTALSNSLTYYWKVAAKNANTTGSYAQNTFTTIVAVPAIVSLTIPMHNAMGVSLNPKLVWGSCINAASYRVQVASTSAFSFLLVNDSVTAMSDSITISLSYGTKYFWRVYARNIGGIGAWATDSFSTLSWNSVVMAPGWNIVSLNFIPIDSNAAALFGSLSHLVIVKQSDGGVYWPSYAINTIGTLRTGYGYQIYTTAADTLRVLGSPVTLASTPISLDAGWNLIAYLPNRNMYITSALAGITSQITIVKDNSGGIYWPDFGINSIDSMKVGMGYSIHMKSDAELLYPYGLGKTKAVASGNSMPKIRHYMLANNTTGRNATLLLKNVVDHSQAVPDSSEIGVYDADGLLVGAGVVMGGRSALTLWGDNEMTKGKDGLSVSEHMTFKVWTPSGEEYPATYSGTNSNGYADNAIMVGTLSINRALVITRCALSNAYPNPFRGTVRIAFDVAAINNKDMQNVEVTIYDLRGTQVCQLVRGIYKTGRYSVIWDSRGNTGSNVYIVMMKTENFTQRMKLFKVK